MIWPGVQLVSFIATAYVRTISCYLLTPIIFMLALQKLQQIFPQKKLQQISSILLFILKIWSNLEYLI